MIAPFQLRELWQHDSLRRARQRLAALDRDIVRLQIAISEIAAPTGGEEQRAAWMADRFRSLSLLDVRVDSAGNVIGRRAGAVNERPVVICAHLDTVFPPDTALTVRQYGARFVGPGIGDNGRGLAGLLALAEAIDGVQLRTMSPIDFVATTGEEGAGDLRGSKRLFATRSSGAGAAIALDGPGDNRIVCRALGSRRYRIEYRGVGGHSWTAFGVPNAVHAAGTAAARLARLRLPQEPRTTLSVGRIGGGIAINVIPDSGWLEVDLRSTSPAVIERLDREIRGVARAAACEENARRAEGTPQLESSVAVIGNRPSGETLSDDPLVMLAIESTRMVGREPDLSTASTDANIPMSQGIPAIAIGAGGHGGEAHTAAEWFENVDGQLGLARALAIVVGAAGLNEQGRGTGDEKGKGTS